ncbi:MAG: hypothetical protein IJF03_07665, partial [Lachnospiraceae bacterium]|nr:hypothetical protein [Lachnospiraceae bacterium]
FYVVSENPKNCIRPKSCKKQKKTPEIRRFQVLFWSCWADLNRRPHPYQFQHTCFPLPFPVLCTSGQPIAAQGLSRLPAVASRILSSAKMHTFFFTVWVPCGFYQMTVS